MYRFMSEEEIEIRQMSDLKMIHLYKLGGSDAIAVHYSDNKQLNLCAMDTNYNLLMGRVLTLYSQCEDKDSILIEAAAKKLLDKAVERGSCHTSFFNRIGSRYLGKESFLSPKFASDGVIRETLLPMLKYYLHQLYHMWNMNIEFEEEPHGWHRKCIIKVRKGEETYILPIKMDFPTGNECRVTIGNFFQNLCTIEFEISYREDRLYVLFESEPYKLLGESHFEISPHKINTYTTIRVDGQVVYHQEEPVELLPNNEDVLKPLSEKHPLFEDIDLDFTHAAIYKLPWGGFAISQCIETEDESYKRQDYNTIYIDGYKNKLVQRQYSYSLIENKFDGLKLRTDGAVMRKLYYGGTKKESETLFMPVGYYSGWDYKAYLEGKYFYHETEEAE